MFIWNKEKYPFSITDADTMDNFNENFENMWNSIVDYEEKNAVNGMIHGEGIKAECKTIDEFFDKTFGDGTSKKMFGKKYDLADRTSAVKKLYNLAKKQLKEQKEKVNEIAKMAGAKLKNDSKETADNTENQE